MDKLKEQILQLTRSISEESKEFIPGETFVPVSGKVIGTREKELMVEAALDGWLTSGRFNDLFEKKLSYILGVKYVLSANSGSSSNLLALAALTSPELGDRAIKSGDEIITTAANFPTTIAPILQIGAVPVFIDIDPHTWNADPELLQKALSPKTKAVFLAHSLGNPFDAEQLKKFCDEHGLWLIEDACDALGATVKGKPVGTFGAFGTLSCYPAHHITMGEGGAVFTNDPLLAKLARSFRDWGRHCHCRPGQDNACGRRFDGQYGDLPQGYDHKYVYSHAGYNMKITDMQAACGVAQLERLPDFVKTRRDNWNFLHEKLKDHQYFDLVSVIDGVEPSWFGFPILLRKNSPVTRVDLLRKLNDKKIGTRLLFAGNAVKQPFLKNQKYRIASSLDNTDAVMDRGFWIGIFPGLNQEMLEYSASTLLDILECK